ncbi:nuclear transport factor 2 family protein [Caulobacter soli]|uniref:nuclear transport factor 2 family protein n=1 Tax=Caulobacter soli TaxID=2708539 RepID=UPI0013E9B9A6|nr:nuclear transport factor 2 family protein [Caulobacter soli]
MSTTIETLLTRNLHEVFGEPDPAKRAIAIQALYAPDSVFSDPHGHYVGHRVLEEAVAALHAKLPGHVFTVISGPDVLRDSGRLAWAFGPPEDPRRVTGLDVAVVKDGRIAALYTFLDAPRAEG